jgi:hypothetical protein
MVGHSLLVVQLWKKKKSFLIIKVGFLDETMCHQLSLVLGKNAISSFVIFQVQSKQNK